MKKITTYLFLFYSIISLGQWTQIGNAINGQAADDRCGYSVAISADGTIVATGSTGNDNGGNGSGQVRVFQETNGVWSQIGSDLNGETGGDQTGQAVSLSEDGSIVAIGEPFNNDLGYTSGQVRVFKYINNNWTQLGQDLYGDNAIAGAGTSVDLSADGSVVAVGAPNETVNGLPFIGKVRVFQYNNNNNNWVQKGGDINGDGSIIKFGKSVSLSSDSNIIAISQTGDPGSQAQSDIGRVKVYSFSNNQWVQLGNTITGSAVNDEFGFKVSLSALGNIIAIGTYGRNQVKIYKLINGTWSQIGNTLVGENPGDSFGFDLNLSADGTNLVVGARFNSSSGASSGRTYVYKNIDGVWTQIGNPIVGVASGDQTGFSVAISNDGSKIATGAILNDGNGSNAGHVRIFENTTLSTPNFTLNQIRFYPNPTTDFVNFKSSQIIERITIYNILGQEVFFKTINTNEFIIDISNQAKGTYIAKLNSDNYLKTIKLVKL